MNPFLLLLLIPPLVVVIIAKFVFHATITWKEAAVQAVVPTFLVFLVWGLSQWSATADTEIWNGKVTGKEQVWTSCSHSYSCNCRTVTSGSGKNQTSTTVCDTCYDHSNDWDWTVHTTVGNFDIDRIDRQGEDEPPRWTIVKVNQPVAVASSYTNYIKAAPDSLVNFARAQGYEGKLPDYPKVYDYQYIDRVIPVGVNVPDLKRWNTLLSESLNDMGSAKQVNINVVMTHESPKFAYALQADWIGGKKNDVTVVIGTNYPNIRWVRVFSWAKSDIINVALRQALLESRTLDPDQTIKIIADTVNSYYERRPMKEFEYLADQAYPSMWLMVFGWIIGLGASIALGIFFHREDPFGTPVNPYYRRYR